MCRSKSTSLFLKKNIYQGRDNKTERRERLVDIGTLFETCTGSTGGFGAFAASQINETDFTDLKIGLCEQM